MPNVPNNDFKPQGEMEENGIEGNLDITKTGGREQNLKEPGNRNIRWKEMELEGTLESQYFRWKEMELERTWISQKQTERNGI